MAIPLFAYSDIDTVEMELLADEIQEEEYQTGHVISKIGQFVVPAVYIVRSGKVVSQERLRIPVGGLLLFARFFSSLPFTFTVASYLTHADDFEWNRLKRLANR
jgi:hypothetical protein